MSEESTVPPMSRTLRLGEALMLVLVLLVALVVVDQRNQARYVNVSSQVDRSEGGWFVPGSLGADPQLCYLLGIVAEGQGKGAEVAGLMPTDGSDTECAAAAARGADGMAFSLPEPSTEP